MGKLGLLGTWWLVGMIAIVVGVYFKVLTLLGGLQILITYTLVLVTAQYAKSAAGQAEANTKMAKEMELARKMQNKPSLIAYFDNPQSNLLDLVIKNVG